MTQSSGPSFSARLPGANPIRVAIVAGVVIVLALSAAITLAASPNPAGTSNGSGPSTPSGSPAPKHGGPAGFGLFGRGFGPSIGAGGLPGFGAGGGGLGRVGAVGGVTVASIDGSNLSLKTADGWTRTIVVTSATKITRAGQTIGIDGLKAGDTIAFQESKASDGTYTINAISVVLPRVFGQVTATTADTITIKQFGGTTTTVHVGSATTFQIFGVSKATIASLKTGMTITAEGTQAGDGSFDALSVSGFQFRMPQPGGHGTPGGNAKPKTGPTTTAPATTAPGA
jgi:Domain of unknown function (DUF5666)